MMNMSQKKNVFRLEEDWLGCLVGLALLLAIIVITRLF